MELMLLSAAATVGLTISLFFLRFWRMTHDRFFLFFAISFAIEACSRIMLGALRYSNEEEPLFYVLRLIGFLLIVYAIIHKNRARR